LKVATYTQKANPNQILLGSDIIGVATGIEVDLPTTKVSGNSMVPSDNTNEQVQYAKVWREDLCASSVLALFLVVLIFLILLIPFIPLPFEETDVFWPSVKIIVWLVLLGWLKALFYYSFYIRLQLKL
jgi:hypothetical protein